MCDGIVEIDVNEVKNKNTLNPCVKMLGIDDDSDEYERNQIITKLKNLIETEYINTTTSINDFEYDIKKGDIYNDDFLSITFKIH